MKNTDMANDQIKKKKKKKNDFFATLNATHMPCDLCEVEPAGTNVNVEKLTKPQKINYYLVQ